MSFTTFMYFVYYLIFNDLFLEILYAMTQGIEEKDNIYSFF